jgi:hypothetical protein
MRDMLHDKKAKGKRLRRKAPAVEGKRQTAKGKWQK